jgi:hypothetical protein
MRVVANDASELAGGSGLTAEPFSDSLADGSVPVSMTTVLASANAVGGLGTKGGGGTTGIGTETGCAATEEASDSGTTDADAPDATGLVDAPGGLTTGFSLTGLCCSSAMFIVCFVISTLSQDAKTPSCRSF